MLGLKSQTFTSQKQLSKKRSKFAGLAILAVTEIIENRSKCTENIKLFNQSTDPKKGLVVDLWA